MKSAPWPRWVHILLQCSLIFVIVAFFLTVLGNFVLENKLLGVIGASSLGATAFIVFVTKDSVAARARNVIGGYLITLLVSMAGYYLLTLIDPNASILAHEHITTIIAGLSMAIVVILMVTFRATHPPAAGFSIILIIAHWTLYNVLTLIATLLLILLLRSILDPWLIDLNN